MPRTADSGSTGDDAGTARRSVPPPPPRPSSPSTAESWGTDPVEATRESAHMPSEAEALAKVEMLSSRSTSDAGPSRAIVATAIGVGVLLVALVLLAIVVSVGPDPGASSVR
jgi:hypothetical protein